MAWSGLVLRRWLWFVSKVGSGSSVAVMVNPVFFLLDGDWGVERSPRRQINRHRVALIGHGRAFASEVYVGGYRIDGLSSAGGKGWME
ncbi:hypothetical protein LZ30DRAFT_730492 [Colletotrichum cereale]|nr:hypothetical protein LZ30DRAFT_730492 [Colletotrichum cereale]